MAVSVSNRGLTGCPDKSYQHYHVVVRLPDTRHTAPANTGINDGRAIKCPPLGDCCHGHKQGLVEALELPPARRLSSQLIDTVSHF